MYKHILIPTDGSGLSEVAIQQGVVLAQATGAKVTGLTVSPTFETAGTVANLGGGTTRDDYVTWCEARAKKRLQRIAEEAGAAGVAYDIMHVFDDLPHDAIIRTAKTKRCDLIAMASHGRTGLAALLLGSETTKVLTHSSIPVLVCRAGDTSKAP